MTKHRLAPRAESTVRSVIGGISGVTINTLSLVNPDVAGERPTVQVDVHLTGWSPSLHVFTMVWRATTVIDGDPDVQARRLLRSVKTQLHIQRTRLAQGLVEGTATPFPIDGSVGGTPVGHLTIDRGLATLMDRDMECTLEATIALGVQLLHDDVVGDGLEETLEFEDRLAGTAYRRVLAMRSGTCFGGDVFAIDQDLPESVKIAAVGRRLGDVVEVPSPIADHAITRIDDTDDGGCEIHVAPRPVRLSTLFEEWGPACTMPREAA